MASFKGHSDVVKLLLEAGADIGLQFKVSVRVFYYRLWDKTSEWTFTQSCRDLHYFS